MHFEISFDHMPEFVLIRTGGEATVQDFDVLLTQLVNSAEWIPGTSQLVDHRRLVLESLDYSAMEAIRGVMANYTGELGSGRCAFVVGDELGFGMARMYDMLGGDAVHAGIGVFYSMDEAMEWIRK